MQIGEASEHRPGDYGRWGEQPVVPLASLLPAFSLFPLLLRLHLLLLIIYSSFWLQLFSCVPAGLPGGQRVEFGLASEPKLLTRFYSTVTQ